MYVNMKTFVDRLEAMASSGFDTGEVDSYLRDTLIEPVSLAPYLTFHAQHYARNLVHKSRTFEILVVCWKIGQRAPIHGHEGERCWARVEQGKLRFANYRQISEEPLMVETLGEPVDGGPGYLDGPADIHAVENPENFGEDAASLHVYSYPFGECDIYDLARGLKKRVRLEYDTMFGKPTSAVS
jgi:hypothetical protein